MNIRETVDWASRATTASTLAEIRGFISSSPVSSSAFSLLSSYSSSLSSESSTQSMYIFLSTSVQNTVRQNTA